MLTCVVNRSIHWYKCTISPFHCSQGIHIVRNCRLHAHVFSSDEDDTDNDDFMLIIVHFKSLYCRNCWQSTVSPAFPSGPQLGGSLAAPGLVKAGGASGADIGCSQRLRAIPCPPPDPSSNSQFGIFFPQTQLGETVVQGFRTPEIDEASSSSKSRMPCLKSAQFGWYQHPPSGLFASFSVWITLSQCSGCSEKISYKILNYHKFWSTSCCDCLFDILMGLFGCVGSVSGARLTVTGAPGCPPWAAPQTRWSPCCSETRGWCSPPSGSGRGGSDPPSFASSASSSGFETRFSPESHWAEAPLQSLSVSPASDIY